jgi:hypothetical protein
MEAHTEIALLQAENRAVKATLERHEAMAERMMASLQRIETTLAGQRLCPSPGMCLTLQPEMVALKARVAAIEADLNRSKGMLVIIGALWTVITAAVIAWWKK